MKATNTLISSLALLMLAYASASSAQVVDISACRQIQDRLERFDCYEALGTEEQDSSASSSSVSGNAAPALPVLQPSRAADPQPVALPQPQAQPAAPVSVSRSETASSDSRNDDAEEDITGTIAALEELTPGLWQVTLTNGQKWRQMVNKHYNLEVGDQVRIYSTSWGSSRRLTVSRLSSFIQVRRVQ